MPTFVINEDGVTVTDDRGDTVTVSRRSRIFEEAARLAMSASWQAYADLAFAEVDIEDELDDMNDELDALEDELDDMDELLLVAGSVSDVVGLVRGLIADEIVSAEDLGLSDTNAGHEHDLSQWNGSPIFYPTEEMAMAQHNRWGMFWDFHDFGPSAPNGYRYATVPRGVGPYAPEGYDWVCLKREDRYKV